MPLLAACGGGGGGSETPAYVSLTNGQAASVVIGQADFSGTSNNQGGGLTPATNTLSNPWGNAATLDGKLYLSDGNNNRVLRFDAIPAANDASATLVLGQSSFTTAALGTAADGMADPLTVAIGSGKLAEAEEANSRVLIWNAIPSANGQGADVVVGWPDFSTPSTGCSSTELSASQGVAIASGKLLVADTSNSRVLIWNAVPTASGAAADLVLGQVDLNHCTGNDADGNNVSDANPTAATMDHPRSVWSDGARLIVADANNNRVLIWNSFPTSSTQPADLVVGQNDFTSSSSGTTSATLSSPSAVYSNGNQLFVADETNHRVLVWNALPSGNGTAADTVLGHTTFTDNNESTSGGSDGFSYPAGLLAYGTQLLVADYNNNRALVFNGQ